MKIYTAAELANNKWWLGTHNLHIGPLPYSDLFETKSGKIKLVYFKPLPGLRSRKIIKYVDGQQKVLLRVV